MLHVGHDRKSHAAPVELLGSRRDGMVLAGVARCVESTLRNVIWAPFYPTAFRRAHGHPLDPAGDRDPVLVTGRPLALAGILQSSVVRRYGG
jgi:hypothetical protein